MNSISVNRFRDNLKSFIEQVVNDHTPIKVTRRAGEDFVVMSADDWEREQETLHVLQSSSLSAANRSFSCYPQQGIRVQTFRRAAK